MLSLTAEQQTYVVEELARQREKGWRLAAGAAHPEALLLWGTIGRAEYLSADGRVWISEALQWGSGSDEETVREARGDEAFGAIRKAVETHLALTGLVPPTPPGATHRTECDGKGIVGATSAGVAVWCGACHALGWVRPRTV